MELGSSISGTSDMINASASGASSWSSSPFSFSDFWSNFGPVKTIFFLLATAFMLSQVLSVISASSVLAACGVILGVFFEIEQAHLRHWQSVNQSNSPKVANTSTTGPTVTSQRNSDLTGIQLQLLGKRFSDAACAIYITALFCYYQMSDKFFPAV